MMVLKRDQGKWRRRNSNRYPGGQGLSPGRVSDILNGRGKEGHGLLYKL